MAYYPDNWTDKELEALERRIAEVFKEAEKDLDKEVKEYFAKFKLRDKEMKALVDAGEMTKAEYQQWRMTQMGRGQRFEALRDKVAERYTKANEVANAYVNDMTPSIYSLNRNYEAYTIEKAVGSCDFTMWDESTVRRLLVEQPDLMPYYPPSRALNRGIDLAYGKSQITKHVTSGIIRGLAPGKIANELMSGITTMNRDSAVRAARTGITAAQNAGRMDSYIAAEKMGIQIKRRWVCTKDARTRLDHGLADGQIVVGTKTPFIVGGYKMMFPGDKSLNAPGHEIYNCRCTTRTVEKDGIEAEPRQMRVRNPETGEWEQVNEMTYSEWVKWKETGKKPEPQIPETPKKTRAMRRDPRNYRRAETTPSTPDFDSMDRNQITSWANDNLKTKIEDITGANTDFVRETVKVISKFEEKLGGKTLDGLTVKFGGVSGNAYADYDDRNRILRLKKSGSLKTFVESQKKDNERSLRKLHKRYHATETFSGTVWHELGHAVDFDSGKALSGALAVTKDIEQKSVKISVYAGSSGGIRATKRSEAWAENFAAYMDGGDTAKEVPTEIVQMIDNYFNKNVENSSRSGIVKVKNSELANGLPIKGTANSTVDKTDDDGKTLQRRIYGDDGMAKVDFDTSDHGLPKAHPNGAHKHTFDFTKKRPRGNPLPLTEEELAENEDIIQKGANYHD